MWLGPIELPTPVVEEWQAPLPASEDRLSISYLRSLSFGAQPLEPVTSLPAATTYERWIVAFYVQGLRQYALLTFPFGDPPDDGWPAVVFNHGDIDPELYQTGTHYQRYIEALASNGFVVLAPDYRGHGESEGVALNAYSTSDYVIDVLTATAALKNHPLINAKRVGMWGHSTGGHITLRALVVDPDIRASVIWGGVLGSYPTLIEQYPTYWEARNQPIPEFDPDNPHENWREHLKRHYGTYLNPAWNEISATSFLGDIGGPIQLHHAREDEWVPFILAEQFAQRMDTDDARVELFAYEEDTHDLARHFDEAAQRTVTFFEHLL
jgi:uncharacterized protein